MQDSIAKEKKWGKKCLEICAIKGEGGVGRLMANAILNFHFDFLHTSLILSHFRKEGPSVQELQYSTMFHIYRCKYCKAMSPFYCFIDTRSIDNEGYSDVIKKVLSADAHLSALQWLANKAQKVKKVGWKQNIEIRSNIQQ